MDVEADADAVSIDDDDKLTTTKSHFQYIQAVSSSWQTLKQKNNIFSSSNYPRLYIIVGAILFVILQGLLLGKTNIINDYNDNHNDVQQQYNGNNHHQHHQQHYLSHEEEQLELELNPSYLILGSDHQQQAPIIQNPLTCEESFFYSTKKECCASWDINIDDWWTLHGHEYEISYESNTKYCFIPIQNIEKKIFLTQLHQLQWGGKTTNSITSEQQLQEHCQHVETTNIPNSGYGAGIRWIMFAAWHAFFNNHPFQFEWSKRIWLYSTPNSSSWSYCPSKDITWYVVYHKNFGW